MTPLKFALDLLGRTFFTTLILSAAVPALLAQTTPPAPENSNQPPSQPTTTAPQAPQQGWMWWDDQHGRDMNIAVDRMKELRGVDERYRKDYEALGATPWTNASYQALTDRRNAEIEPLLTPAQFQEVYSAHKPHDRFAPYYHPSGSSHAAVMLSMIGLSCPSG